MVEKSSTAVERRAENCSHQSHTRNSFNIMLERMPNYSPMTLDKEKRIRKRRDFLHIQRCGSRSFGRFIIAVAKRDKGGGAGKVGITVPKKVGAAHQRNKIKRRIRHILR